MLASYSLLKITCITSFRWKPSWYQNETATINEYRKVKTGSVKPLRGNRPMKRRGIDSKEVTISFRGKIIKIVSQRKNERDLTRYTEQMLYLQELIFNIRVRREVRNVADLLQCEKMLQCEKVVDDLLQCEKIGKWC